MNALIFAAGAQGRITLEVLRALGRYREIAFLDDEAKTWGTEVLGARVLGNPESIAAEKRADHEVVVALGHPHQRLATAQRLGALGFPFLTAVHPTAFVSPSAQIGAGTVLCASAIVHTGAVVGAHCIVNTGGIVEHDSVLEDGVCLSPRAIVAGRVRIGRAAFLGIGALVLPRLTVGEAAILGATGVATRDIPPRGYAIGSPARVLAPVDENFDWRTLF
jgi:acetyltransferase EpsM